MKYVAATLTFVIALPITMFVFEKFPQAYFDLLKRLSWGREIGGILMCSVALGAAFIAFRLAS